MKIGSLHDFALFPCCTFYVDASRGRELKSLDDSDGLLQHRPTVVIRDLFCAMLLLCLS